MPLLKEVFMILVLVKYEDRHRQMFHFPHLSETVYETYKWYALYEDVHFPHSLNRDNHHVGEIGV